MLRFYTSRYSYGGKNRLDITVKGQDPVGKVFAPSWGMVMDLKEGKLSRKHYILEYYKLMRTRYTENKESWNRLLARDEAVLVCFEKPEEGFCHRFILAAILRKMGAEYLGELNADGSFWGDMDLDKFVEKG